VDGRNLGSRIYEVAVLVSELSLSDCPTLNFKLEFFFSPTLN
jgi:hypothetical protein